jgi:hypothetical protein
VVVLTVAAWQAAIQDMVASALDAGMPPSGGALAPETYSVLAGRMWQEVERFSTPNPENTRRLLLGVGFDPRPHWTWRQSGGRGVGWIVVSPHDVEERMQKWLRLRHDIAHGHDQLTPVDVLLAVREKSSIPTGWQPSVRLVDAKACMAFFRRVTNLTAAPLGAHLGQPSGRWLN